MKRRIVLAVLFFVIGLAALSYGIVKVRTAKAEWTEIKISDASDTNIAGDFTFQYHLGESGVSATSEKKVLTRMYSAEMVELFRLYTATKYVEDVNNVYEINRHPNQELEVDPRLYHALKVSAEKGGRSLYYGPYYEYYNSLFFAEEDYTAEYFDPTRNRDAEKYFEELSVFIRDPEAIRLEFPSENSVLLWVSDEYLEYAEQAGIEVFLDLSLMQNAFAADDVAALFHKNGLTNGYLVSNDGFIVNLNEKEQMTFSEYAFSDGKASVKNSYTINGACSIVTLRSFPMRADDLVRYYVYEDGSVVNSYINDQGLQTAQFDTISAYSDTRSCAEIFFSLLPYETGALGKKSLSEIADALSVEGITFIR